MGRRRRERWWGLETEREGGAGRERREREMGRRRGEGWGRD